jgi:tRNA A-37 threonylcarbamoyl transferase component Bud32
MTYFPLQLFGLPSVNLLRQFEQVRHSKQRSPRRYSHERIDRTHVGPTHRQRMQATIFLALKPDPVLAPVLAVRHEFEFLLVQRMVGMSYSEESALSVAMRRT